MDHYLYGPCIMHTLYWLNQTPSRGTQRGWHLERNRGAGSIKTKKYTQNRGITYRAGLLLFHNKP